MVRGVQLGSVILSEEDFQTQEDGRFLNDQVMTGWLDVITGELVTTGSE